MLAIENWGFGGFFSTYGLPTSTTQHMAVERQQLNFSVTESASAVYIGR